MERRTISLSYRIHASSSSTARATLGSTAMRARSKMTTAPFMIELDDDVVEAPQGWDATLLDAYRRLPEIGFLAADLVDEPGDPVSRHRHYVRSERVSVVSVEQSALAGGDRRGVVCDDRSKALRSGGSFPERGDLPHEEAEYIGKIAELDTGPRSWPTFAYTTLGDYNSLTNHLRRSSFGLAGIAERCVRSVSKRALLRVPLVGRMNTRYGLFQPPDLSAKVERTMQPPRASGGWRTSDD